MNIHIVLVAFWVNVVVGSSYSYQVFTGDGSTAQGWPAVSEWLTFDDLWDLNVEILSTSCSPTYGENNSPLEVDAIKNSIPEAARYANVPPSLLFTMMMQESDGCVRVGSTAAAVTNPGLMQSNNGEGNCFGRNPCPPEMIRMMLMDGAGKDRDFGMKQAVDLFIDAKSPERFYRAARAYNAGPLGVVPSHLEQGGATRCYASDIANRLLGWNHRADTACTFDHPALQSVPVPTQVGTLFSHSETSAGYISETSVIGMPPATRLAPGISLSCDTYYLVKDGDTCNIVAAKYNTSFERLRLLNTELDSNCTNLWRDYYYCMA